MLSKINNPNKEKDIYYQINILNKLLKDIESIKNQISDQYIGRKLNDKELLQINELKVPISRLYLYEGLIKNKEIFSGQVKSTLFKDNLSQFTDCVKELFITKNMVSFKKMVNILRHNPYLFTLMDLIFLYKEFANTVIGNVTYLMDLFTNLYLTNVNFKIIIDKTQFVFQSNELKMI